MMWEKEANLEKQVNTEISSGSEDYQLVADALISP